MCLLSTKESNQYILLRYSNFNFYIMDNCFLFVYFLNIIIHCMLNLNYWTGGRKFEFLSWIIKSTREAIKCQNFPVLPTKLLRDLPEQRIEFFSLVCLRCTNRIPNSSLSCCQYNFLGLSSFISSIQYFLLSNMFIDFLHRSHHFM